MPAKHMKTIDRYLLREHLAPVLYCLSAFFMVFVTWHLFDHLSEFLEAETPILQVVRFYVCSLLPAIEYLAPTALLFGTLYTLWYFSRHNELAAMRAGGASLYRLVLPFLGVGLAFTLGSAVLKETLVPQTSKWAHDFERGKFRKLKTEYAWRRPYYNSINRRAWMVERFDPKNPAKLHGVEVTNERSDGTRQRQITGSMAQWMDGTWWFYDARVQDISEYDVPIGKPRPFGPLNGEVCELPFLTERPSDLSSEVKAEEFWSTLEIWRYLQRHPDLSERDRATKLYALHSRLATPWACFIITLIAIPAGSRSARQSALSGIFLSISLFFAFYILAQLGLLAAGSGLLSPWLGAWLSNIVFLVAGLAMTLRMR